MIKIIIVIYYGWETEIGRYLCPSEYCIHSCQCHQVWRVHLHHHIAGQVVIVSCVHTCTLWWYLWCHLLMWGEQHKDETQKSAFKVGRHRPNLDFVHQSPGAGLGLMCKIQVWLSCTNLKWQVSNFVCVVCPTSAGSITKDVSVLTKLGCCVKCVMTTITVFVLVETLFRCDNYDFVLVKTLIRCVISTITIFY